MNENWYEKADDYLHGRMSPQERSDFESELAGKGEILSDLHIYQAIETAMQGREKNIKEEQALKRSLQALGEVYFAAQPSGQTSPTVRPASYKMVLAAAAILILIAVVYLLAVPHTTGPHQLAAQYIDQHLATLGQTMNASKDSLQQGIAAYNNKEYKRHCTCSNG
jgi:hypothetical protein